MAPLRKGLTNAVDRAEAERERRRRELREQNAERLDLGPKRRRKRRRRSDSPDYCRDCGTQRYEGELFFRDRCETCRDKHASAARARTGARALAKAKDAGTVERDGRTFTVVQLPAKRRPPPRSLARRGPSLSTFSPRKGAAAKCRRALKRGAMKQEQG